MAWRGIYRDAAELQDGAGVAPGLHVALLLAQLTQRLAMASQRLEVVACVGLLFCMFKLVNLSVEFD
jgi:hypothetical protein